VNLAGISFAYLRARPLATALNLLLLALGIATMTVLLLATAQLEERMGRDARDKFLKDLQVPNSEAVKQSWQKHYFQGIATDGTRAPVHQAKLELAEFVDESGQGKK